MKFEVGKQYNIIPTRENNGISIGVNRDISQRNVDRIAEDMFVNGYKREYPILINQDGVILDGQHRWLGAIKTHKSVWVLCTDMTVEQARKYNNMSKKQSAKDNLVIMAKLGDESAKIYLSIINKYRFPIRVIDVLNIGRRFRNDTADRKVENAEALTARCERLDNILDSVWEGEATGLHEGLKDALASIVYYGEGIDDERLIRKLTVFKDKTIGRHGTKMADYMAEVEACYNAHCKANERVYFAQKTIDARK